MAPTVMRQAFIASLSLLALTGNVLADTPETLTVTVDNVTVPANESTVAPAVEVVDASSSVIDADYFPSETQQLTDSIISNLTNVELTNADLFAFDDDVSADSAAVAKRSGACKVYPDDKAWPSDIIWSLLDLVLGGQLIKTVPIAAPCYSSWGSVYSPTECDYITSQFEISTIHYKDPTSMMWPLYQGRTCMPTTDPSGSCTLGAYPNYAVNVSSVAHVQLAVNFARATNIRLVVKNTGHDFAGKSGGSGSLGIWTHNLKDITYLKTFKSGAYSGPAVKMGSGVQAIEIYAFAKANGITVVGGEGRTVGVSGGYIAGGGHSPLSSLYGMAADQVLALEVVTADGRFVTASADINPDLYWALRGGGGSTFGVVTSLIVKTYPVISAITVATFSFSTTDTINSTVFWKAVRDYFEDFPTYASQGTYAYFSIFSIGPDAYLFGMAPFFAPGKTTAQAQAILAPWMKKMAAAGIVVSPVYTTYNNFYDAWYAAFPLEAVGTTTVKTASRLFPKTNWANSTILDTTVDTIKSTVADGGAFLSFQIAAPLSKTNVANSVNPAWRETYLHAILAVLTPDGSSNATRIANSQKLTNDWMARYRAITPGAGSYMSEADAEEPNFQQSFFGSAYSRLYALKQKYDPKGVFYAGKAVGSEDWVVTGQLAGLSTQYGRLCRA